MNTTDCQSPFARDALFLPQGSSVEPQCTLIMPLYFIPLCVYTIILGTVAYIRTLLVIKRKNKKPRGGSALNPYIPWITVVASWVSFFVVLLLIIVPVTYGAFNNAIVFIFGLECLSFNILSERWLRKLVRLGSKIIAPSTNRSIQDSRSDDAAAHPVGDSNQKNADYLSKADNILKGFDISLIAAMTVQVICFCVLSMARPSEEVWFRVGVALEGLYVCLGACALIWQYERCKKAIATVSGDVQGIISDDQSQKKRMNSVQTKFRRHQLILFCASFPTTVLGVLWGAGVIPLNYIVIVFLGFCDAMVNGGVLVTFIKRSATRRASRTTAGIEQTGPSYFQNTHTTMMVAPPSPSQFPTDEARQ